MEIRERELKMRQIFELTNLVSFSDLWYRKFVSPGQRTYEITDLRNNKLAKNPCTKNARIKKTCLIVGLMNLVVQEYGYGLPSK